MAHWELFLIEMAHLKLLWIDWFNSLKTLLHKYGSRHVKVTLSELAQTKLFLSESAHLKLFLIEFAGMKRGLLPPASPPWSTGGPLMASSSIVEGEGRSSYCIRKPTYSLNKLSESIFILVFVKGFRIFFFCSNCIHNPCPGF
jgi:hypothetical protein